MLYREYDTDRQLREALYPTVQTYKAEVPTPVLVNATWQSIWKMIGDAAGEIYVVPGCDRSKDELLRLREANREALIFPDRIYTPEGLLGLGRAFPLMRCWPTNPSEEELQDRRYNPDDKEGIGGIIHNSPYGGCIDVEMDTCAPYVQFSVRELELIFEKRGLTGMRLPTYLVAAQFSHLLTGGYNLQTGVNGYFDLNSDSRLLGTTFARKKLDGRLHRYPMDARFIVEGGVELNSFYHVSGRTQSLLGGRTEGRRT